MCLVTDPNSAARSSLPDSAGGPPVPAPTRHRLAPVLLGLILLSLIPAFILAYQRVTFEQSKKTTSYVMDYPNLVSQAQRYGLDPQALLDRYKALGLNGVAVYEDTIGSLQQRGEVYYEDGSDLAVQFPGQGAQPQKSYLRSLKPGVAESLPARYTIPTRLVQIGGNQWVEWATDPRFLPAGPNTALINDLKAQGMTLVYRPYGDDAVREPGADWPDVPFISFPSTEVIGARSPELLEKINERMGKRIPALIEATPQRGLDELVARHGAARLFSISAAWQNLLSPEETASKFALAARERGHRLLYLRTFPTIGETEAFLKRTTELLGRAGVKLANPTITRYNPNLLLQILSAVGPIAALLLLGLSYPLVRLGLLFSTLTALLAFGLNSLGPDGFKPLEGLALIAAVTFPSLGLVLRRRRVSDWFLATGLSLAGALFVSALGANGNSMLGLEPFRGVGLTLVLPLVLVGASFLPRQDLRKTAADIYNSPIKLGDIVVMGLGIAVFALVFLRRGNTSSVGVSDAEKEVRQNLQDSIIRPRFKELAGHPLALLGLSGVLPGYFSTFVLLGGVIGQASLLNTFSHFHTPLLISAARCFIGLGVGLVAGYVVIWAVQQAIRLWSSYGTRRAGAAA
jgi:hypothetical protein